MRSAKPCVDVIISTYNAGHFLKACFESLRAHTKWPCNVIITDDCSDEPELLGYLKELALSGQAAVLINQARLGFAANNACAVEKTRERFFCLLNQDTMPQAWWLTRMMEVMLSDEKIGIVGAKLLFPAGKAETAGTIQHVGVGRDVYSAPYHPYKARPADFPPANALREVNAVTGACMLVRRECWNELGGFDQRYAMGQFEDVDFCWRARNKGWKIFVQPEATVFHYEHGCGEEFVQEGHDKNRALLLKEWAHLGSDENLFPEGGRFD